MGTSMKIESKIWQSAAPVPHCSILVMFSCSRLFTHASSSCLIHPSVTRTSQPIVGSRGTNLDSPMVG
ncbi:uncharacterized protein BDW47DRAFT_100807 [Aspergillus candidus]|uniref:Uncharacterized protein n=1 Tax=Aspergillus candidus TaxID=41067 RepID=A0A2I2FJI1_ASPCN|nr:hypothetical protein BDW47DRAFT_100807 [Aspergillus candidus]PLB40772.1 hypothetical protein BDW47DRAFT_100807 [Aspergillus candidus]